MDPRQPQPTPPVAPQPEPASTPAAQQPAFTPTPAPAPAPAPVNPQAVGTNPGKGLGIASLIVSFFAGIVGIILGIIGLKKSKAAGMGNGPAVAGIIVGILTTIGGILILLGAITAFMAIGQKCADLGPGTHVVNGATYTCGSSSTGIDTFNSTDSTLNVNN